MLVARPDLVRVRLELARAFFLKGEDGLAGKHFEEVLAGDVPDEVKTNVRLFLAGIRDRRRWSFNLGVAVAPDTSIGAVSDERIIINGLPFERDAGELTTSGAGLSFRCGADMCWTDYERGWFPFVADGGPREDRTRSWRLSACNRALTLPGFSP